MRHKRKRRFWRVLLYLVLFAILLIASFTTWYIFDTRITPPSVNTAVVKNYQRTQLGPDHFAIGNNWLKKNDYGLWEMYLEGEPFERGIISGKLTEELIFKQENAFVEKIREMIPSESYLDFLKYFIRFFNRDIDEYILPEYQKEIYGISFSASDKFDFIGTKYERMLNYHAAHDIGHALQDLMLVGCTSFAANMGFSDSSFILGRNFDFFINEAFAEDKIVCFVNPSKGHQFTFITWASFTGVVSGMNNQGLTVTINAGKSDIPFKAATPISLVAREILQYAGNIEEAIAIAEKRKIFVAESLLIGSAMDNMAVIIEKSPSKLGVFQTKNNFLVCSNHFQSNAFADDPDNLDHIKESASPYRQQRAEELLLEKDTINYLEAAEILRDKRGIGGSDIGIGNEKTMAQMISHHSVIFQPLKRRLWVSTEPYQLGEYLGYDQDSIFIEFDERNPEYVLYDTTLTIPADPVLEMETYHNYLLFKDWSAIVKSAAANGTLLEDDYVETFCKLNPGYYLGYELAGDYYAAIGNTEKAIRFYNFSLTKEVEKTSQKEVIDENISQINSH